MFKRLLVPVDGTERDHDGVAIACRLAKQFGSSVLLVHIASLAAPNRDLAASTLALEHLADTVRRQDVACDFALHLDETISGIMAMARYENSDLIVLTPHTHPWFERLQHPSVTSALIARSTLPLLVWPEHMPAEAVNTFLTSADAGIIVPLDGSELAERAIPFACDLTREFKRPLKLVRVLTPVVRPYIAAGNGVAVATLREDEEEEVRAYLRRVRESTAALVKVPIHSMMLSGIPAEVLTDLASAHPNSVMVMTTHGRGPVGRVIFGSVTTDLAHRLCIPLFVVHSSTTAAVPEHEQQPVSVTQHQQ